MILPLKKSIRIEGRPNIRKTGTSIRSGLNKNSPIKLITVTKPPFWRHLIAKILPIHKPIGKQRKVRKSLLKLKNGISSPTKWPMIMNKMKTIFSRFQINKKLKNILMFIKKKPR